ncbi:FAD-dependent monooxygenase [Oxalobacteraceae bacterium A2-2]
MSTDTILIAGAGPTGLMLAMQLARRGLGVRIIDQNPGPGRASRAMVVHARTLELYRQLGLADAIVAQGLPIVHMHLCEGGKELAQLALGEIGAGLSPYPYVLAYAQDEHERYLVEQLRAAGVEVEWNTRLDRLVEQDGAVHFRLERGGLAEQGQAAWVCGCDGVRSQVRSQLGLDFEGGTYEHLYYVADVDIGQDNSDLYVNLGPDSFALMLPVRTRGMQRLIGIMPAGAEGNPEPTFEDVRDSAEPLLGVQVRAVNWFSTYRVHHRVASQFRQGRCFLLGDAAHVHSPAGGQGMNTGLGDAVNLSWKLAQVMQGRAAPAILDSYQAERMAFARKLVATTDRAFRAIVAQGVGGELLRAWLLPGALPMLEHVGAARRLLFRTISQIQLNYHEGPLSGGRAGEVVGGDRLPWVRSGDSDNHAALASLDWQLHIYGTLSENLYGEAQALGVPLQRYAWSQAAHDAGLLRDAAYLVRPDGYVGLCLPRQEAGALPEYAVRHGLCLTAG